jgi:hypothetical protein
MFVRRSHYLDPIPAAIVISTQFVGVLTWASMPEDRSLLGSKARHAISLSFSPLLFVVIPNHYPGWHVADET